MTGNNRILIIDDDPGVRDSYKEILFPVPKEEVLQKGALLFGEPGQQHEEIERQQYDLTFAEKGEEGVEAVKKAIEEKSPLALAFIDMKMYGIDGAETSKRIWAIDPYIKIIIVTAHSEYTPDDIIRVTGRDDIFYLRKPFNPEEIRQFAKALTNEWNLERERERLNDELEDLNKNLQKKVEEQTGLLIQSEKMASIGRLTAGVAHEILNPVNIISIRLKLLSTTEELSDRAKETISICKDQLNRITRISKDLGEFSRIHEKKLTQCDLNEVIEHVLSLINPQLKQECVETVAKYDPTLPLVPLYKDKIEQVFFNLLSNATAAMSGQETKILRITTKPGALENRVQLIFSDTGKGIVDGDMKSIFDPFFTTKDPGKGTGLGLFISYNIIKEHGGEIWGENNEWGGASFFVELPVGGIADNE